MIIAAGKTSVVIAGVGLGAASMVLATIQQAAGGNAVSSAVPNPSMARITITLFKAAAVKTKVAWFVLN